ncbi:MAG: acyl-CoA reductase [Bacteroidota bacterium]
MNLQENTIQAWTKVSEQIRMILDKSERSTFSDQWSVVCRQAEAENPWFTHDQLSLALHGISMILDPEKLQAFASKYQNGGTGKSKNIGVIMAGNIPAAGFHDLLCVSLSNHRLAAKLSSSDKILLPFIKSILEWADPIEATKIRFVENLKDVDAVIATGSDNSARYFEYYFGKKPHIFRKNRNSVGIITGEENEYDLILLGRDIFTYFGLGCRSVSKLFVPESYRFDSFFEGMLEYKAVMQHTRYMNNHDYQQALYLMNQETFLTNNFLIVKEDTRLSSPVGVVFFENYQNKDSLQSKLNSISDKLQCIVKKGGEINPGQAQIPSISDFADGIDTMEFLSKLD